MNLLDLPEIYHPWSKVYGWDYWKIYAQELPSHITADLIYEAYGISQERGAIFFVRPDQHLAQVVGLYDVGDVEGYFHTLIRGT